MTEKGPKQWRIQGRGPGSPLFSDQTEARRADKIFFGDRPPLSKGLDDRPPPLISRSRSDTAKSAWLILC